VGVKVYPPSGYRIASNSIPARPSGAIAAAQWDSRYVHLGGNAAQRSARLDALHRELFTLCASRGLPVFAHTSYGGFEALKGYGETHCDP